MLHFLSMHYSSIIYITNNVWKCWHHSIVDVYMFVKKKCIFYVWGKWLTLYQKNCMYPALWSRQWNIFLEVAALFYTNFCPFKDNAFEMQAPLCITTSTNYSEFEHYYWFLWIFSSWMYHSHSHITHSFPVWILL